MKRLLTLATAFLLTSCSGPVETVTLSGQVKLPQASVNAFKVEGAPLLLSNLDGNLGKPHAASLDAGGRFSFRIERESLPEAPQWFKLVLLHPDRKGPMLSRALVLSRASADMAKLELQTTSSAAQMGLEIQYQLDATRVPTTTTPESLEAKLDETIDANLLDNAYHAAYALYASGSSAVAPAADSDLGSWAWELLFPAAP